MRFASYIALSLVAAMVAHESLGVPLHAQGELQTDQSMGAMAGVGVAGLAVGAGAGFLAGGKV